MKTTFKKIKKNLFKKLLNFNMKNKRTIKKNESSKYERNQYNRNLAKEYAEKYALEPNTKEYPYYKTDDCTNFISQVLRAGGVKEVGNRWDSYESWFCNTIDSSNKGLTSVSITWRAARYFRKHWGEENGVGRKRASYYEKIMVNDAIKDFSRIYDLLEIGDLVQHVDLVKGDYPYHTQVVHKKSSVLLGNPDLLMAQHTANRKNVSLYRYLMSLEHKDKRYICIYKI